VSWVVALLTLANAKTRTEPVGNCSPILAVRPPDFSKHAHKERNIWSFTRAASQNTLRQPIGTWRSAKYRMMSTPTTNNAAASNVARPVRSSRCRTNNKALLETALLLALLGLTGAGLSASVVVEAASVALGRFRRGDHESSSSNTHALFRGRTYRGLSDPASRDGIGQIQVWRPRIIIVEHPRVVSRPDISRAQRPGQP
jgi:hypothetical protein